MSFKVMNQDFVKLDEFDETNFICWQDKMKFLLNVMKIFFVLDPNLQPICESSLNDIDALKEVGKKREEDELVCRSHIFLNTLSDRLYIWSFHHNDFTKGHMAASWYTYIWMNVMKKFLICGLRNKQYQLRPNN